MEIEYPPVPEVEIDLDGALTSPGGTTAEAAPRAGKRQKLERRPTYGPEYLPPSMVPDNRTRPEYREEPTSDIRKIALKVMGASKIPEGLQTRKGAARAKLNRDQTLDLYKQLAAATPMKQFAVDTDGLSHRLGAAGSAVNVGKVVDGIKKSALTLSTANLARGSAGAIQAAIQTAATVPQWTQKIVNELYAQSREANTALGAGEAAIEAATKLLATGTHREKMTAFFILAVVARYSVKTVWKFFTHYLKVFKEVDWVAAWDALRTQQKQEGAESRAEEATAVEQEAAKLEGVIMGQKLMTQADSWIRDILANSHLLTDTDVRGKFVRYINGVGCTDTLEQIKNVTAKFSDKAIVEKLWLIGTGIGIWEKLDYISESGPAIDAKILFLQQRRVPGYDDLVAGDMSSRIAVLGHDRFKRDLNQAYMQNVMSYANCGPGEILSILAFFMIRDWGARALKEGKRRGDILLRLNDTAEDQKNTLRGIFTEFIGGAVHRKDCVVEFRNFSAQVIKALFRDNLARSDELMQEFLEGEDLGVAKDEFLSEVLTAGADFNANLSTPLATFIIDKLYEPTDEVAGDDRDHSNTVYTAPWGGGGGKRRKKSKRKPRKTIRRKTIRRKSTKRKPRKSKRNLRKTKVRKKSRKLSRK
jgi:hypothetical protein